MRQTNPDVMGLLLDALDEAFDRKSWHGTNLRGSIRGLSASRVVWRPAKGRHNIHELVLHCAYWKYAVWRRLQGEPRGSFPRGGSNWFAVDRADEPTWREDVALLGRMHRMLREAVESTPAARLGRTLPGSDLTRVALVRGAAAHDVYHAGQIQLIKRLSAPPEAGAS